MSSIALPSEDTGTDSLTALRAARNRQNAQHSTGPRTKQGKSRSAQNARTHGLSATTPPTAVPVPDPTANLAYATLKQELLEEHHPTTPTQHVLLDELTLIIWKLQYLPRIEHRLLNTPLDRPDTPKPDPAHLTPHPRLDHPNDPTAAVYALHLAQDTPTALTRLHALHHRLQSRLNSILNQLRHSRKDQQQHHQDDQDNARAQRNAQVDRSLTKRAIEQANHRALDEEIQKTKQNIQQREQQARLDRHRAAAAQNTPSAPIAAPTQKSLAVSRTQPLPTPNLTPPSAPAHL